MWATSQFCILFIVTLTYFLIVQAEDMAPWHNLLKRSMQASPSAGVVTLATIEKGRPRARTVLFQGLIKGADGKLGIAIKTSADSRKVKDAASPFVEIVWWMEESYNQWRFSGPITYTDHEDDRKRVWNQLGQGSGAQGQFFFPVDEENPLDLSSQGTKFRQGDRDFHSKGSSDPPDNFLLGVLYPDEVDMLNLASLERANFKLGKDGKWAASTGFAPPVVSTTL